MSQDREYTLFRPLHDRVLVLRDEPDTMTKSGFEIPRSNRERKPSGVIISTGSGMYLEDGRLRPLDVHAGQKILFRPTAGELQTIHDVEYTLLREDDINLVDGVPILDRVIIRRDEPKLVSRLVIPRAYVDALREACTYGVVEAIGPGQWTSFTKTDIRRPMRAVVGARVLFRCKHDAAVQVLDAERVVVRDFDVFCEVEAA